MITEKKREFRQAFILTSKELDQLGRVAQEVMDTCDELSKNYENTQYRDNYSRWQIVCSEDTNYSTGKFSDVKEFDNPERKKIKELRLEVGELRGLTLSLCLTEAGDKNISYTIRGPVKEVLHIEEMVADFVSAMKPSYDWVVGGEDNVGNNIALVGCIPLSYIWFSSSTPSPSLYALIYIVPLSLIAVGFVTMILLKFVQHVFAPSAIFAINAGTKEIERFKSRRQFLVYGVFLAIIVPLAIWALQAYTSGNMATSTP